MATHILGTVQWIGEYFHFLFLKTMEACLIKKKVIATLFHSFTIQDF